MLTDAQLRAARAGLLVLRVEPQPKIVDADWWVWILPPSGAYIRLPADAVDAQKQILTAFSPHQPGERIPLCRLCNGTGQIKAYRGEPSQGYEIVTCDLCGGKPGYLLVESVDVHHYLGTGHANEFYEAAASVGWNWLIRGTYTEGEA